MERRQPDEQAQGVRARASTGRTVWCCGVSSPGARICAPCPIAGRARQAGRRFLYLRCTCPKTGQFLPSSSYPYLPSASTKESPNFSRALLLLPTPPKPLRLHFAALDASAPPAFRCVSVCSPASAYFRCLAVRIRLAPPLASLRSKQLTTPIYHPRRCSVHSYSS